MFQKIKIFILFIAIIGISSCTSNKFKVDVSDIDINLKIKRLDVDLYKFNADSSKYYINKFKSDYGEFFKLYNFKIIRLGSCDSSDYPNKLNQFIAYCEKENINKTVNKKFSDFKNTETEITDVLKHYKYYFPKKNIPQVYTCISAFNESIITSDSIIGIALDKYLGYNDEFYKRLNWDKYMRRRMTPEMISVDVAEALANVDFPYEIKADNMLENMIYNGKIHYFINCMLPETADTLKWRYTAQQLAWANANEHNVWNHLADKKLLFTTDKLKIKQYAGEAPFTVALSKNSAPRVVNFIAYKIVNSYMENNPNISLKQLMEEKDARKILAEARYNPK